MRRVQLARHQDRFVAMDLTDKREIFSVVGVPAAKAALRFFGVVTEIQESFFNVTYGPHIYYVEAP